jgi:hypothetical protein
MKGDITAGMRRSAEAGRPEGRLMAKIYGAPQEVIDDSRPDDWLPYAMGYVAAMSGAERPDDGEMAKEYFLGFERGENVKAGKAPAPSWIKTAQKAG